MIPGCSSNEASLNSISWVDTFSASPNYLRENVAYPYENPPVGIILCAERDAETVRYATAGPDNQLFVSRYLIALPSEATLKQWLREEQERLSEPKEQL